MQMPHNRGFAAEGERYQGMPLFKIVLLYWCVVELIHVIVTLTCFPIAKQLTKWISTDFFDTFEFEHQVVSPDLFCFAVIFLVMFCVLSISMFRFWKFLIIEFPNFLYAFCFGVIDIPPY